MSPVASFAQLFVLAAEVLLVVWHCLPQDRQQEGMAIWQEEGGQQGDQGLRRVVMSLVGH